MNWVRWEIIDRNVAAAFIQTPQSYSSAKKRFVRATSYAMEQWDERMVKTMRLPEKVSEEDLFAIARIHFPGLVEKSLRNVVNACAASERNYVSDVSKIAALARDSARAPGGDCRRRGGGGAGFAHQFRFRIFRRAHLGERRLTSSDILIFESRSKKRPLPFSGVVMKS